MPTRQLFPVQKHFSKPCAFANQARAAAAWQVCEEKLLKRNCFGEKAVHSAVQRPSHQPPPLPLQTTQSTSLGVSTQPLCLEITCFALWHFSWWESQMAWRLRGRLLPSLPRRGSPAEQRCAPDAELLMLPAGRQLPSCYNIKPVSLCLDRGLGINTVLPHLAVHVVPWHRLWGTESPAAGFLCLSQVTSAQKRRCFAPHCQDEARPPMFAVAELAWVGNVNQWGGGCCPTCCLALLQQPPWSHPLHWPSPIFNTETDVYE